MVIPEFSKNLHWENVSEFCKTEPSQLMAVTPGIDRACSELSSRLVTVGKPTLAAAFVFLVAELDFG